ncbi:MAG: NAD-dependent epimerase/dehydratase family protein [Pirellulales bacterium]|nr:NAD-dependent epimerase/dehydratase family protein [Pirellulales bacterium]
MATKLIIGCGYLGWRAAQLWRAAGFQLAAATRSTARADEYRRGGVAPIVADVASRQSLGCLPDAETVLFAVGYDRSSGVDIQTVYALGLQNVLSALPPTVERVIYISTTGVYGSADGRWVDEATPPDPRRDGGRASLAAERILTQHPLGRRSAILRLAGIYGPGRVPYLENLKRGQAIAAPSAGWLNLIHVDDAARSVVAADRWLEAQRGAAGPHIFCVADGAPVVRREYYAEAARLIGAPPPHFVDPPADSPAAARAGADRRVRNARLTGELEVKLQYPSYREGLAAILCSGGGY